MDYSLLQPNRHRWLVSRALTVERLRRRFRIDERLGRHIIQGQPCVMDMSKWAIVTYGNQSPRVHPFAVLIHSGSLEHIYLTPWLHAAPIASLPSELAFRASSPLPKSSPWPMTIQLLPSQNSPAHDPSSGPLNQANPLRSQLQYNTTKLTGLTD